MQNILTLDFDELQILNSWQRASRKQLCYVYGLKVFHLHTHNKNTSN